MAICPQCGFDGAGVPTAANDNTRTIIAANDNELRDPESVRELAVATVKLRISRRAFLNFLAETIFWFDGRIVRRSGTPFVVSDTLVDDHFPDGSARWISSFWRFADTPPRQSAQRRVCDRLRIIRIAIEITDPDFGPCLRGKRRPSEVPD